MPIDARALAVRTAVVATTTAAAALLLPLPTPATPAHTPLPVPTATATFTLPVAAVRLASTAAASAATAPALARATAVERALSKIGAPYRWGAAGPDAFDCSGLVSWAFRQAGTSLPRTSRAMSGVGTPVPRSELQPGDLVFFYRPVSHVGIYIGDGKIVHASRRGSPVKVSDMSRMAFTSARRIGGVS